MYPYRSRCRRPRSRARRPQTLRRRSVLLEVLEARQLLAVVSDDVSDDTVWTLAESPYEVTTDIEIEAGATLTIEPGTVIQFAPDARLTVEGRILAEGLPDRRIVFERAGEGAWDGLKFEGTLADNRITYTDMIGGDAQGEAIDIDDSRLFLDHVTWSDVDDTILELSHPSLIVRNSHFPAAPSGAEIIHGSQISGSEYLIVQGNVFENSNTGGDVIDFLGAETPGPVLQILDNVFLGGGDDGLDLDGTDAHIEGNLFMNFRRNTGRATTANAIATGLPQNGDDNRTEITVVRNIFINNDHAVLLKEEAFATIEHNLFLDTVEAVIQFDEVGGSSVLGVGKGAELRHNIFSNNAQLFKNLIDQPEFTTLLTVDHNLIPNEVIDFDGTDRNLFELGTGNFEADPMFVAPGSMNFTLQDGSPARAAGFGGLDLGPFVPSGGVIGVVDRSNETTQLRVGGPGVTQYRYRVNEGPLSDLQEVDDRITLTDVTPDTRVEVVAMNSAGEWYSHPSRPFGYEAFETIVPKRTRTGESLPVVVRRLNWNGEVDTLSSENVAWTGHGDREQITLLKGVGVVSETVTQTNDFVTSIGDTSQATIGDANGASTEIQILGDQFPTMTVEGTLSGDIRWNADTEYHVPSDLSLDAGSTLTIDPGTRILLGEDVNFTVRGELKVRGQADDPVLFNAQTAGQAWGGIDIRNDGSAEIQYAFFTQGGGDVSREFGHSSSQPVLRASSTTLDCNHCFVIDNEGKGFGATNGFVNIRDSVVSLNDTGGEFNNSVAKINDTWVLNIPNDQRTSFVDDDNDGFYFAGAHASGEPSHFVDSFVVNTKDDGLDHNGARLEITNAWIEGGYHEGLASSNTNWARVHNSVFTRNNQGVEAGYGSPDLTVTQSVVVGNRNTIDSDSPMTAGVRFGDGYSSREYSGQITASHLVIHDNGDNVRNWDNGNAMEHPGAIRLTDSLANDDDFPDNLSGIPVFGPSMHLLRGSAGFEDGPEGMPLGRVVAAATWQPNEPNLEGDFDGNGLRDLNDLGLLCAALVDAEQGAVNLDFDLTRDGQLDSNDRDRMVLPILGLLYGDANLDGRFNSSDLVAIFARGQFEDAIQRNSGWADGDWNCDQEFTTQDIVLAFQQGGYTAEAAPADGLTRLAPAEFGMGLALQSVAAALAVDSVFGAEIDDD